MGELEGPSLGRARTHLLLLAAVVIWGSTFVATKVCLEHMRPLQLVGSRFLIGAPALFLMARIQGARLNVVPVARPLALAAAIFSAHFLLQTWALDLTTATNTGWIIALTPLIIAALAALVLSEPLSRPLVLGLVLASIGVVLLISRGRLDSLGWLSSPGDWLVVVTTLTWAIYTIVTRDLSRRCDPVAIAFAVTIPLALSGLVFPFVLPRWTPFAELPAEAWTCLVFLGVFGLALAHWFWQAGVATLGAGSAGLYLYLEPLVTTAIAVPVLGEGFGGAAVAGGALILAGVYVSQRRS